MELLILKKIFLALLSLVTLRIGLLIGFLSNGKKIFIDKILPFTSLFFTFSLLGIFLLKPFFENKFSSFFNFNFLENKNFIFLWIVFIIMCYLPKIKNIISEAVRQKINSEIINETSEKIYDKIMYDNVSLLKLRKALIKAEKEEKKKGANSNTPDTN